MACRACIPQRPRQGLAALTVVLALFFVLAMVAAYTNRNLVFEQRMSAGTARGERAFAAAEAGVDWAVGMINAGRLSTTCGISQQAADVEFRRRYLVLDPESGGYDVLGAGGLDNRIYPGCQINGTVLNCVCPTVSEPNPVLQGGNVNDASFRVGFLVPGPANSTNRTPPGSVLIQVRGCANSGIGTSACYTRNVDPDVDAVTYVRALLGLVRALPVPPLATVTAGGNITAAAALQAANSDSQTGLVLHAGGAINLQPGSQLTGPAGSAGSSGATQSDGDAALAQLLATNRMFENVFGMARVGFSRQPATVRIPCAGNPCRTSDLDAANWLTAYQGRAIWVPNDLVIDTVPAAGAVGTDTSPLMLVVNGDLDIQASISMVGFVFANNIAWNNAGANLRGAAMAADQFTANAAATLAYDSTVLNLIHKSYGSFVRVPGGWTRGRYQ